MESKVIAWVIVIAIIGGGVFLWDRRQKVKECEERALVASVETYPINEYPNTGERAQLQNEYKQRYIRQSCQQ